MYTTLFLFLSSFFFFLLSSHSFFLSLSYLSYFLPQNRSHMPRSSKKQFNNALRKEIWKLFLQGVRNAGDPAHAESFLSKFLTEDERIVLEKRLAVLYFLNQGNSLRETSRNADVSKRTVVFVKRGLRKSKFKVKHYPKYYRTEKVPKRHMPTYRGKGRWDFLNRP